MCAIRCNPARVDKRRVCSVCVEQKPAPRSPATIHSQRYFNARVKINKWCVPVVLGSATTHRQSLCFRGGNGPLNSECSCSTCSRVGGVVSLLFGFRLRGRVSNSEDGRSDFRARVERNKAPPPPHEAGERRREGPADEQRTQYTFKTHNTHSGGNNFNSSMFPRNPNKVLICSEVVLGDTLVTCITLVLLFMMLTGPSPAS